MPATRAWGKAWDLEPESRGWIITTLQVDGWLANGICDLRKGCKVGDTFFPAYRPRVMMATRPTLRTGTRQYRELYCVALAATNISSW